MLLHPARLTLCPRSSNLNMSPRVIFMLFFLVPILLYLFEYDYCKKNITIYILMDSAYIYMTRYIVACYITMCEIYMDVVALNRWIRRQLGEKAWWLGGWKRLWSSNSFEDPMKSMKGEQIIRRRLIYIYIHIFFYLYIYILVEMNQGTILQRGSPHFETRHM